MEEITLEKTHALLERLAEYVMTQVATRGELNELRQDMNERFEQVDKRFEQIDKRFEQVDKRFEQIDKQFVNIEEQLGVIRSEQQVFTQTFELHHRRFTRLENESSGFRVRDGGGEEQ